MIRIWGRADAFNVQKALWALAEVGQPFERVDLGGAFGGLDEPAYRALNPQGGVPTIDDDGVVVWESNAIVRYLGARYGVGTLWDPDPGARAAADRWMDWMQTTLYRDFMDLFWRLVRTPKPERDRPLIETLNRRLDAHYGLLDAELAARPYLAGESFSMADIPAGTTLYRYFEMEIERPDLPHVEAWYRRLAERPAYLELVMQPFDQLRGRSGF